MEKEFERWFFDGAAVKAAERNPDGGYKYMPAVQAWNAWKEACKYKAEACAEIAEAAMSDANKYDIAEAIRNAR